MTRVAIVGPGRMGTLLGAAMVRAGRRVTAVAGGSQASRRRMVSLTSGARPSSTPAEAASRAELIMLTVPDDAIADVVTELVRADAIGERHRVVHVAGSRGVGVLRRAALAGAGVAACHPAMTVPAGSSDPSSLYGVAWAVTAPDAHRGWAHDLVTDLGGDAHDVAEDRRALYHAGLVLASNAVGAAVVTARQLLLAASVDDPAAFIGPLARVSADNAARNGAKALTGPIRRGDIGTVRTHLDGIVADTPVLGEAYRHLALATLAPIRAMLDDDVVAALDAVLAPSTPTGGAGSGSLDRSDTDDR